jgi:NTE family protein
MPTRLRTGSLSVGLLSAGLLAGFPVVAQDAPIQPKEPKIGLVLEGGAALGLAHIGVLQWLEENRIPVSYVAGTSMGGLVGGLYATGNSPAEIRKLVEGIDWDVVLRGEVPYQDLSFRRKEDAVEYPNGLVFGIKGGIRFPEGFNSGHQVGLILDRIALPYSQLNNFDDLPIPFACVATDLMSNKPRVFRSGSLTQALRSTMSLPGIFTPVRAKNAVYVDGGLLDNLPVDVARQMGAEMTIAIHLETQPLGANEPLSSVGVLGRSLSVVVAANELRSMQQADVLVSVPLAKFSSTDYEKSEEIIHLGYEAAAGKASVLSRFSVDEATWQQYLAQRSARKRTVAVPQFVEVAGTSPKLAEQIEGQMSNTVGKPIDTSELERQLTYLTGDGRFSNIGYQMVTKDNKTGLRVNTKEKEFAPPEVRPLVVIDGNQWDQVQFQLGARITFLDVGSFGSEWRNDVVLGSEHGIRSEFYRPFGEKLRWFVAPQGFAFNNQLNYYKANTLLAQYRNREGGGAFEFGYAASRSSELRIGYQAAYQKLYPKIGALRYETLEGRVGTTSLLYGRDRRNDPIIPTAGYEARFKSAWFDANPGAQSGFALSEARLGGFKPMSSISSLFGVGAGGTTYSYHNTGFPPFQLGGGPDFLAYGKNGFLTNQYFLFKAGYLRKLFSLPPIVGDKIYLAVSYEAGKIYDVPRGTSSLPTDGSVAIVMKTIFGPFTIGGAYGATGHAKFFYQLGRVF